MRWSEPPDLSREQVEFYAIRVSHGAREGGPAAHDAAVRADPARAKYTHTARVVLAATTFGGEVRASNPRGAGGWSERLIATTPAPTRAPLRPAPPEVRVSAATCDLVVVAQPSAGATTPAGGDGAEGGCAGPETLRLEALAAGSTHWKAVRPMAKATRLTLGAAELADRTAYRFRMVAANRLGEGPPGEPSAPVVGGLPPAALQAPSVVATSSASFEVALPALEAPCLDGLAWTVLARVGSAAPPSRDRSPPAVEEGAREEEVGGGAWRVVGTGRPGTRVHTDRLRCPAAGCRFKLRPDVRSFAAAPSPPSSASSLPALLSNGFETPSAIARNRALPALGGSSVRVEVRLNGAQWNSLLREQLLADLRHALRLRAPPTVAEAHAAASGDATYVVIDLHDPYSREAALGEAQELANLLADDRLYGGVEPERTMLRRIDRAAGVAAPAAVLADWARRWTAGIGRAGGGAAGAGGALRGASPAVDGGWVLLQPHVETALDRLLWNAQLAAALLLSLGIAWAAVRARRAVHRWRELGGAMPLAMSEEDAEEEEAERAARRRAAKAARQMVGDANDDDWPT